MANSTNDSRIYQQIETDADTWDPWVYNLLSFYSTGLEVQPDPLAQNYIPLTTAQPPRGTQVLPFFIGFIPPSAKVTGRVLNREASVASVYGVSDAALLADGGGVGSSSGPGGGTKKLSLWIHKNPQEFYDKFVGMCNRLGVNPYDMIRIMMNESQLNPAAMNTLPPYPKGLIQMTPETANIYMSKEKFANYQNVPAAEQLSDVEKFFKRAGLKPGSTRGDIYKLVFLPNVTPGPDGELAHMGGPYYSSNAGPTFSEWGLDVNKDGKITIQDLSDKTDFILPPYVEAGLAKGIENNGGVVPPPVVGGDAGTGAKTDWPTDGSKDASTAKKAEDKTADKNLAANKLYDRLMDAQSNQALAMKVALEQMAKTPPLKMLVNPTSFKVAGSKIISDGSWARNGPVIQHWGDDHDKIDVSGKIAGFYAVDAAAENVSGPGLTRMARNFSASYQNFLSLYLIYKNNGGVYLPDGDPTGTKPTNLVVVGSVYIYYDNTLYIGSFESFTVTETDTAPFTLEYNYSFNVRAAFLLDKPQDPRRSYGITNSVPTSTADTQYGGAPGGGAVPPPPGYPGPADPKDPNLWIEEYMTPAQIEDANYRANVLGTADEFADATGLGKSTTIKTTTGKK